MKVIFKYNLPLTPEVVKIPIPIKSKPLSVQVQPQSLDSRNVKIVAWFLIDDENMLEEVEIACVWTGKHIGDDIKIIEYLGTVTLGIMVTHYFIVKTGLK